MKKALGTKFIAEAFQKKLSISFHNFYWYKKNENKFEEMTLNILWAPTPNRIKKKKKQLRAIL